jgi:hypothetical protein
VQLCSFCNNPFSHLTGKEKMQRKAIAKTRPTGNSSIDFAWSPDWIAALVADIAAACMGDMRWVKGGQCMQCVCMCVLCLYCVCAVCVNNMSPTHILHDVYLNYYCCLYVCMDDLASRNATCRQAVNQLQFSLSASATSGASRGSITTAPRPLLGGAAGAGAAASKGLMRSKSLPSPPPATAGTAGAAGVVKHGVRADTDTDTDTDSNTNVVDLTEEDAEFNTVGASSKVPSARPHKRRAIIEDSDDEDPGTSSTAATATATAYSHQSLLKRHVSDADILQTTHHRRAAIAATAATAATASLSASTLLTTGKVLSDVEGGCSNSQQSTARKDSTYSSLRSVAKILHAKLDQTGQLTFDPDGVVERFALFAYLLLLLLF